MDDLAVGGWVIPSSALTETFETTGGPGGQHANRNATGVRLRLDVAASGLPTSVQDKIRSRLGSTIEVVASEERSQLRNRERARERLIDRLNQALADPKPRKATKPTKASKKRRSDEKKRRSQTKKNRQRPGPDD